MVSKVLHDICYFILPPHVKDRWRLGSSGQSDVAAMLSSCIIRLWKGLLYLSEPECWLAAQRASPTHVRGLVIPAADAREILQNTAKTIFSLLAQALLFLY